jgi:hypothetical protein
MKKHPQLQNYADNWAFNDLAQLSLKNLKLKSTRATALSLQNRFESV